MQSCLGIQIENNIIKYAKVQKEKDSIKVEAFNVVFYENLNRTIDRIIEETNSFKTPIVVNLANEKYEYFQIPALLNKNYRRNHVEIAFEEICEDKRINKDTIDTRFLFTTEPDNSDQTRTIAIYAEQGEIEQKKLNFSKYKLTQISPLSVSIANLIEKNEKENSVIVNIENKTKITTILKNEIVKIDTIDEGMEEILERIDGVENSKQKSYEVCKNTTIYTQASENVSEGNEHLDVIMPTLNTIAMKVKNTIETNGIGITKIYITGLATSINNIDLYFQDYFTDVKCEILRPFFSNTSSIKTSIKDYIEVNSAIALALDGIGYGFDELNFFAVKNPSKIGISKNNINPIPKIKDTVKSSFDAQPKSLLPVEWVLIRVAIAIALIIIGYLIVTMSTNSKIQEENEKVKIEIANAENELKKAEMDIKTIQTQTAEYKEAIEELNKLEDNGLSTVIVPKSAIPNLLYRLMEITPSFVQITSIENTEGTKIVITAQSKYYEQLGFLNAAISTNDYLLNVKTTSGVKDAEGLISVTIEGYLPSK